MEEPKAVARKLPIIQYWHREEIPDDITGTIASFRNHNRDLPHMLFNEVTADRFIEEHLTNRELAAFRACAVPAMQSDYFRYCAVLVLGGIYADTDLFCTRPLQSLIEPGVEGLLFKPIEKPAPANNNFFLFTVPGHPMLRLAIDVSTDNIERRIADKISWVTGPWVIRTLWLVREAGSFDAARRHLPGRRLQRMVGSVVRAAGTHRQVVQAFENVRIVPRSHTAKWFSRPPYILRYKQGVTHWPNWQNRGNGIYRG